MVIQPLSLRMNINCLHVPVLDATDFQFFWKSKPSISKKTLNFNVSYKIFKKLTEQGILKCRWLKKLLLHANVSWQFCNLYSLRFCLRSFAA